jgi:hypothetical protein
MLGVMAYVWERWLGRSEVRTRRTCACQLLLPGVDDGNAGVGKVVLVACDQA